MYVNIYIYISHIHIVHIDKFITYIYTHRFNHLCLRIHPIGSRLMSFHGVEHLDLTHLEPWAALWDG